MASSNTNQINMMLQQENEKIKLELLKNTIAAQLQEQKEKTKNELINQIIAAIVIIIGMVWAEAFKKLLFERYNLFGDNRAFFEILLYVGLLTIILVTLMTIIRKLSIRK